MTETEEKLFEILEKAQHDLTAYLSYQKFGDALEESKAGKNVNAYDIVRLLKRGLALMGHVQ